MILHSVRRVNSSAAPLSSGQCVRQQSDIRAPEAGNVFSARGRRRMLSGRAATRCGRRADKSAPNTPTQYPQHNKTLTHADTQTDGQAGGQRDTAPRRAVARWRISIRFANVGGVLYNRSCHSSYGRSLSRPLAKFRFLFENHNLCL